MIARQLAAVTVLSDNRAHPEEVRTPSVILQRSEDAIAPPGVGDCVHRHTRGSQTVFLDAAAHGPHLSAPSVTTAATKAYLVS